MVMVKRTMVDSGSRRSGGCNHHLQTVDSSISIDCGSRSQQLRFRPSFRSLFACCAAGFQPSTGGHDDDRYNSLSQASNSASSTTVVTGTFLGHRKGRVSFCIQENTKSAPLLLLEFTVPTSFIAREMQHGVLRIMLECDRRKGFVVVGEERCSSQHQLYDVPIWSMYCNGRKVGFAVRRHVTVSDSAILKLMQSVSVGAGVLPVDGGGDVIMYLRASFRRVIGSADSESFHMINPVGSSGQELSIFFLRT